MRMSIMGFENKIEFKEGIVNVFEIYNQKLFSEIINTINNQCNGEDDDNSIVLMENEKRLNIEKTIYLLTDLFNIDFNAKKILNKMYRELPIYNAKEIEITPIEIANLLERKPGSYLKNVISNLERQIVYGKVNNNKLDIEKYILENEENILE